MLLKKSRYHNLPPFRPKAKDSGQPESEGGVFRGICARALELPEGVVEHTITENDRLDHLAQHYYNDDRLWWRIVDANPDLLFADHLLGPDYVGDAILIPRGKN